MGEDRDVTRAIREAPKEIGTIIMEVLKLEREVLTQQRPRISDDIVRIIKKAIADGERQENH